MKYQIISTEQFELDFDEAVDYLKYQSQTVTLNFIEEIEKKIKILETSPEIGKKATDVRLEGLRILVITKYNYVIIYEVKHEEKSVYLYDLFHSKRDIPNAYLKLKR